MIAFFVLASLAFHQGISKGTVTVEKRFDSFIYFFLWKTGRVKRRFLSRRFFQPSRHPAACREHKQKNIYSCVSQYFELLERIQPSVRTVVL